MAAFISSVDHSFSDAGSRAPGTQQSLPGDDLPLPRGMLDAAVSLPPPPPRRQRSDAQDPRLNPRGAAASSALASPRPRHHASDSGIGSTVTGSVRSESADMPVHTRSAVTRSVSTMSASSGQTLSRQAAKEILRYIITPILNESAHKDFHPLIRDIPRRITQKEVLCLRDLEKTLVYLAPSRARSAKAYLGFCETSIRCIQATVTHLTERDQVRPTDAPYTNGYFVNLVEQVRRYASEMAASRQRQAAGDEVEDDDYSPSEKVVLQGGLSQTGKPARLVRVKDGKTIPIGKGQPDGAAYEDGPSSAMKRSLSDQSVDDSARRSMARRRKLAPGEVATEPAPLVCRCCGKICKRPCDLTKHEKTHSRPWKCTESGCRYHTFGWPTEKERDRHVNDKHSRAPQLFDCLFPNCTYKSKRESNCKQHMEKAHGWEYKRAKGNGKKAQTGSATTTPPTPHIATPGSVSAGAPTPMSGDSFEGPFDQPHTAYLADAGPVEGAAVPGDGAVEDDPLSGMTGPYGGLDGMFPPFDINDFQAPAAAFWADESSAFQSSSAFRPSPTVSQRAEQGLDVESFDFSALNDLDAWNAQLLTPGLSTELRPYGSFSEANDAGCAAAAYGPVQTLSPGRRPNAMLYSPASAVDEDFDGFNPTARGDFTLLSDNNSSSLGSVNEGMFHNMSSFGAPAFQGAQYVHQAGLGLSMSQTFEELVDMEVDEQ
ncbi:MAG: copper-binding transcription factor [Thelocarpon impressellum]|nr:MAG: copper-binding transcription factor [Thelocarpon impressellum]